MPDDFEDDLGDVQIARRTLRTSFQNSYNENALVYYTQNYQEWTKNIIIPAEDNGCGKWNNGLAEISGWMSSMMNRVSIEVLPKRPQALSEYEALGCYCSHSNPNDGVEQCHGAIFLFAEEIVDTIGSLRENGMAFEYAQKLWAWVLLHELAHAMLDESNLPYPMFPKPVFTYENEPTKTLTYWMEESLANYIMLQYVKATASKDEYEACKTFVAEMQDGPYKLALKYAGSEIDWSFWRLHKKSIYLQYAGDITGQQATTWYTAAQSEADNVVIALNDLIKSVKKLPY